MPVASSDTWAVGDAYEPYIGRWSRLVAREFIAWLDPSPDARWLEVGCGTGALAEAIVTSSNPASVQAIDPSPAFLAFARNRISDPRALFLVGDARSIPQSSESADIVVSGLVLNFVPQPSHAVAEMARVTRAGGTVALYVWDYADRMELIRAFWDAAVALDPAATALDEARRFPICQPRELESLFREAKLRNVETTAIDVPTRFRDFDDYWDPFLGGQGPAPGYAMGLAEDRRTARRERLRGALPIAADGAIPLVARAWAVRGTRG